MRRGVTNEEAMYAFLSANIPVMNTRKTTTPQINRVKVMTHA